MPMNIPLNDSAGYPTDNTLSIGIFFEISEQRLFCKWLQNVSRDRYQKGYFTQ